MRRDLGLDDGRGAARLRTEAAAPAVEKRLRARLGAAFAGAWIRPGDTRLTVAVIDASAGATVRTEGATPVLAGRAETDLARSRTALDRNAGKARAAAVRGWYVDTPGNRAVVLAAPGREGAARDFARASGAGTVTVLTEAEQPRPDVRHPGRRPVRRASCGRR